MGNIWQTLIKCILYIFIEVTGWRVVPTTLVKSPKKLGNLYWRQSINEKNINEIGFFLDSNLNFTIRVFTWGLTNDLHLCKKYEKPAKHVILSNLIFKK